MGCPGCGVENPPGSAFCKECGLALGAEEPGQIPPGATPPSLASPGGPPHQAPPGASAYQAPPQAAYQAPPGVPHPYVVQVPLVPQPVYQPLVVAAQPVYAGPRSEGLCVAGMVLGIVGLALFWIPFLPLPCGILGIILGGIGIRNVQLNPDRVTGAGMGVAGLVTGILAVIGGIIMLVVYYGG